MRMFTRLGAVTLLVASGFAGSWPGFEGARPAVAIRSNVGVSGATPQQLELVRWAVGRFQAAGLEPPAVEIAFHDDGSGCGGHLGFARVGRVSVCTTLVNAMTRRTVLHEMSHIWLDSHTTHSLRDRFVSFRGLRSWNAASDPWELRGYEQGAEIMSWALGERILTPQIPGNDQGSIEEAYEFLTGMGTPKP
jgi:hypothetical protein